VTQSQLRPLFIGFSPPEHHISPASRRDRTVVEELTLEELCLRMYALRFYTVRIIPPTPHTHLQFSPLKPSGHYMYHQFDILQFHVLPTQWIYVFCVDVRTNSDYFPIQH
jgi:hypothetical protein